MTKNITKAQQVAMDIVESTPLVSGREVALTREQLVDLIARGIDTAPVWTGFHSFLSRASGIVDDAVHRRYGIANHGTRSQGHSQSYLTRALEDGEITASDLYELLLDVAVASRAAAVQAASDEVSRLVRQLHEVNEVVDSHRLHTVLEEGLQVSADRIRGLA